MLARAREIVKVDVPQTVARLIATDPVIQTESRRRGIRARTVGDTKTSVAQEFLRFQQNEFMRGSELTQHMAEIMEQDGHVIGAFFLNVLYGIVRFAEGE